MWEKVKIKDIVSGFFDGPHATPEETEEGPIFLGIKNITPDGRIDLSDTKHLSETDFGRWTKRVTPQENDIVFTYEATLHRYALIPKGLRCCLGRRLALLRIDEEKAHYKFVHYWMLGETWRSLIESKIITGATVDRIPLIEFPDFTIPLPPLPLQRQIAAVLGRYDALLKNYQDQVTALEGLAQELYREWFVRGRCPGMEAGATGELPTGWERVKLFDIAKITYGFPFDSSLFNEEFDGKPVIRIRDVLDSTTKTYTPEDAPDKYLLKNGDILVGMDGEFHIAKWTGGEAYLNQRVLRASPAAGIPRYFLYYAIKPPIQFLNTIIVGTTVAHLGDADLRKIEVILPDSASLAEFGRITDPIFDKVINLEAQITILRATRDALLPRLLSGQLVPAAAPVS